MLKALISVGIVVVVTSACAGYSTSSTTSAGEDAPMFYTTPVESTINVDLPADVAFKNILENARTCWFSVFSGTIESIPHDPALGYGRVAFVMPGRLVGSKVTLASVDIYRASPSQSTLVSRFHSTGGNWEDFDMSRWAQGKASAC